MENYNLKLLRHYIFIDPNNVHCDINEHSLLKEIKSIHNEFYTNGEIVKYWGYDDIALLLKKYDEELYDLFLKINYNFPALLADVGRYVILYYYGGIYHDLKCISGGNLNMLNYLENEIDPNITFIGHDAGSSVVSRNVISLQIKHPLLHSTLQSMKKKLIDTRNNKYCGGIVNDASKLFDVACEPYIHMFMDYYNKNDDIIKRNLEDNLVFFHHHIYSKNITKWQNTYEPIFAK